MILNPELQRYGWLEFSLHRLVAMPVVIGVLLYLAGQGPTNPAANIATIAQGIYLVLIGLWGTYKAAESVIEEVNDNTWDFQRLSSTSPQSLTLGKLLGSTSYCWYGGLMALGAYLVASLFYLPFVPVMCNTLLLLLCGLIAHAAALLSSLQAVHAKSSARGKIRVITHQIAGILSGLFFMSSTLSEREIGRLQDGAAQTINWYGIQCDLLTFMICLAGIMLAWLIGGAYWQLRTQLRMRSGPWLWAAFILFMMFYVSGFATEDKGFFDVTDKGLRGVTSLGPIIGFGVALASFYIMMFIEPWDGVLYRRLLDNWRKRHKANVMHLFPRWLTSFLLMLAALLLCVFEYMGTPKVLVMILAQLSFAVRDVAILHYFKLVPDHKRANATAIFYLAILYGLIPALLGAFHAFDAIRLFVPSPSLPDGGFATLSLISGSIQAALVVMLACRRWRKYWR